MKCLTCKNGEPVYGTTTFTADRDGVIVVVRNVPARICNTCGEEYFDDDIAASVLKQVKEAAKAGGEVSINEFAAA